MTTPRESRAALQLLTGEAVSVASDLLARVRGSADVRRAALLDGVPEVVGYYSEGSAALAADFYEDWREQAGVTDSFTAELVLVDRTVKIRRGIAWASEPLFDGDDEGSSKRLAQIVQFESARPFRDTVLENRNRDPAAVGWRRVASSGACKFCRMLADRGAVYRQATARFAAHKGVCHCIAEPVFGPNDTGESASVMQYMASRKNRTPAQRAQLRDYLDTYY